jgi:hypothetical protein
MTRFRCPECGIETKIETRHGNEIVSAYCLKHTEGADEHTRAVRMTAMPAARAVWGRRGRTPEMETVGAVRAPAAAGRNPQ